MNVKVIVLVFLLWSFWRPLAPKASVFGQLQLNARVYRQFSIEARVYSAQNALEQGPSESSSAVVDNQLFVNVGELARDQTIVIGIEGLGPGQEKRLTGRHRGPRRLSFPLKRAAKYGKINIVVGVKAL